MEGGWVSTENLKEKGSLFKVEVERQAIKINQNPSEML